MFERVEILKEGADYVFNRFERTIEGLTEQEQDWSPMEESNNMRWILNGQIAYLRGTIKRHREKDL